MKENKKDQKENVSSSKPIRDEEFYRRVARGEEELPEPSQPCYIHDIEDGNATPYDPDKHRLCLLCAVKLWEMARAGTEFDRGDTTVVMMLIPRRPETRGPTEGSGADDREA